MVVCTLGDLTLDVIVRLGGPVAPGGDVDAEIAIGPGGQAANVAAWAAALGADARFVGRTGADDAGALGIADRQVARLVSRRGELEAEAHYSERVYPGLVWMSLHFAEAKVNWLTHDVGDPLIGTPEYKVSAVRVEPLAHA